MVITFPGGKPEPVLTCNSHSYMYWPRCVDTHVVTFVIHGSPQRFGVMVERFGYGLSVLQTNTSGFHISFAVNDKMRLCGQGGWTLWS